MSKVKYLEAYEFGDKHQDLIQILEEETIRANLEEVDIKLYLPNTKKIDGMYCDILAQVNGSKNNGYKIKLHLPIIEHHKKDPRISIKHELAHIKYGDCDRNLPKIINFFL